MPLKTESNAYCREKAAQIAENSKKALDPADNIVASKYVMSHDFSKVLLFVVVISI